MVRIMVGTLLDAGRGKKTPEDFKKLLGPGSRSDAGATVPPYALYLNRILIGDEKA